MSRCRIITADVLQWAAEYDGEPFHALLCDPPYELGFMSRKWDSTGISYRPETWAALARHLHPGAFLMAFAGTRGYHRMACAIEDAGFVIHPLIVWAFGSGFPKATRIKGDPVFDGHRYGLQALKPALECICVAQVPYAGRPVDSITATGAGALNIDGARIGTGDNLNGGAYSTNRITRAIEPGGAGKRQCSPQGNYMAPSGRWPSNLTLDESAAAALDRQSGMSVSNIRESEDVDARGACYSLGRTGVTARGHTDSGGCSRYFLVSDWQAEQIEQAEPHCVLCGVLLPTKAGYNDRDKEPLSCPRNDLIPAVASSAASSISHRAGIPDSALTSALPHGLPENEGRSDASNISALDAALSSPTSPETINGTAPGSVQALLSEQIRQIVSSAESLCVSCGTATAQSLVLTLQGQSPDLVLGQASMCEHRRQILNLSLARYAESLESTGTTPTITSLREWIGSVLRAIDDFTNPARSGVKTASGPIIPLYTIDAPFRYEAKAGRRERDAGLDGPEQFVDDGRQTPIDNPYLRGGTPRVNVHPTVKPLRLTRWLATLLLPPVEYAPRRILVPFCGSGSEAVGAELAGWDEVLGIELSEEYAEIARARAKFWSGNVGLFDALTAPDAEPDAQEAMEL